MACNLSYISSLTGDCTNTSSGAFSIEIFGSAPDYSIQWVSPLTGTTSLGIGVTDYSQTGLTAGTYTFNIIDSCSPTNNILPVNINISSGTCVSITGLKSTLCNLNNGSLTANTSNLYGTSSFSLYGTGGFITSGLSASNLYIFNSLSADTYYVVGNDGGGCTGKSETCIVKSSSTLDFGFYVVDDAGCNVNSGKIFVTGLTGVPPYTYVWSNGGNTSSITGLSQGSYSVTITDSTGCVQSKGALVSLVPNIGLGSIFVDNPSCFSATADVTVTVTGGTAPYYYSASNGTIEVTFSPVVTFSGVSTGYFTVKVTDAGLCSFTTSTTVLSPGGLSIVSINTTNSLCNNLTGKIDIVLLGGTPPYTYTLIDSNANSSNVTTLSPAYSFNNLGSDTYTIVISDNGGVCTYTDTFIISNDVLFELSANTTGTTCNLSDGSVELYISTGGTGPYRYELTGQPFIDTGSSSYTYNNLVSGNYIATVTDLATLCSQYINIVIDTSESVNFILFATDTTTGSNGTIQTYITNGEPPFALNWSDNVNGQTGLTITNLTAGTYSLTVTDSNGCVQTRIVEVNGYNLISSYQVYNICESDFTNSSLTLIKKPKQMLIEGFYDLTTGDTNCVLNQAIFTLEVDINGDVKTSEIFTGTTFDEYPSDNFLTFNLKFLLLTYEGIGGVNIDIDNNKIDVIAACDENNPLANANITVNLKISYDISCESCGDCWIDKFSFKIFDISGYEIIGTFQNTNVEINGYPSFFAVIVNFAGIVYYDTILNQWVSQSYNDNFGLGPSGNTPIGEWYFGDELIGELYCGDENYCINYCIGDVCYNMSTIKVYDNVTMEYFYVLDNNTDLSIQYSSDTGNWIAFSGSTVVSEKEGNPDEFPIGEWSAISIVSSFSSTTEVCELSNFCQCFDFSSSTDVNEITYFDCNYSANTITLDFGDTINNLCVISNQNIITGDFGNKGFYISDDDLITSLCDNTICT